LLLLLLLLLAKLSARLYGAKHFDKPSAHTQTSTHTHTDSICLHFNCRLSPALKRKIANNSSSVVAAANSNNSNNINNSNNNSNTHFMALSYAFNAVNSFVRGCVKYIFMV